LIVAGKADDNRDNGRHQQSFVALRRAPQCAAAAHGKGVAIIPTASGTHPQSDSDYLYRFDSYFYYPERFPRARAVLVLGLAGRAAQVDSLLRERIRSASSGRACARSRGRKGRVWFREAYPVESLDEHMRSCRRSACALLRPRADAGWDARIMGWLNQVRRKHARRQRARRNPRRAHRARRDAPLQGRWRARRDAPRAAISVTRTNARCARPALERSEYEIEAELLYEFVAAAPSIPPTGPSLPEEPTPASCITATTTRGSPTGIFLLIDAGCELDGYASDVTRTFP